MPDNLTADSAEPKAHKAGVVALIGKPNVGKSTLLNHLVGQKVSIVSNKPQTTRRRVLGIATAIDYQIAFIDTPGIHEPHTRLGRAMVEQARTALSDVDLMMYVTDISRMPNEEDKEIARLLKPFIARNSEEGTWNSELGERNPKAPKAESAAKAKAKKAKVPAESKSVPNSELRAPNSEFPLLLCLNKMDILRADQVVEHVEAYCKLLGTEDYMLTSATKGSNVDKLLEMILKYMPEGPSMYAEDEFTDQSSRFMSAELVREKILQATRQEIPHATAVLVEDWEVKDDLVHIRATIFVEKTSQRAILIGKHGEFLKRIGTQARLEIETLIGNRVYLELFVKVRLDWRMDPRVLQELEYSE